MASISPPTFPSPSTRSYPNFHKFSFQNPKLPSRLRRLSPSTLYSYSLSSSHSLSRVPDSTLCRCHSSNSDNSDSSSPSENSVVNNRWDSAIQEVVSNAFKRFNDYVNSYRNHSKDVVKNVDVVERGIEAQEDDDDEDWDWDRWKEHFSEVDEQERIVSILKSQLVHAVSREDYEDASRLKVAIAAAATNDTVGSVMSHLNRAIEEERYRDAAFIRDYAGAGLVGWWAGISEDTNDPYGRIIHISAEHGRYVARSYSPRQLATATAGIPLFEIFLTINKKGEYKQQGRSQWSSISTPTPPLTLPCPLHLREGHGQERQGHLRDPKPHVRARAATPNTTAPAASPSMVPRYPHLSLKVSVSFQEMEH